MLNTFRRSGHLSSTMRVSEASMMLIREWLPQFFWRTKKNQSERREFLSEAPTNSTGSGVSNFDPVLISLIRRAMPNLVAYDLAGVQPMNGPTGLIFAMRSRFHESGWYRSTVRRSKHRILQQWNQLLATSYVYWISRLLRLV